MAEKVWQVARLLSVPLSGRDKTYHAVLPGRTFPVHVCWQVQHIEDVVEMTGYMWSVDRYNIDDVTGMIGYVWSVDRYNT